MRRLWGALIGATIGAAGGSAVGPPIGFSMIGIIDLDGSYALKFRVIGICVGAILGWILGVLLHSLWSALQAKR